MPIIIRKLKEYFVKMSAPYVKLDTPLSELAVVCRGCMADSGQMKSIWEWDLVEDFRKYTGVQLQNNENVSDLICMTCEETLTKCKLFELQCKKSDMILRNLVMKNVQNKPSIEITNKIAFEFDDKQLIFSIEAPITEENLNFPCPYNCIDTYIKKNDLLNHLIRRHEHKKDYAIEYHYHCWEKGCLYNLNTGNNKYFTGRKYMNQHYNKVHRTKTFHCDSCDGDFATSAEFNRHHESCNVVFACNNCDKSYVSRDRYLVHLMRRHPEKHKEYKNAKKAEKRVAKEQPAIKKLRKVAPIESLFTMKSPNSLKRSFATQTLEAEETITNDVTLPSWQGTKTDEISTQTGFEDTLSLKSQNSEDGSLFYSETTLSNIQTQTFPLEFGLSRSHKQTLTENIDQSIKATQTCFCYCDSPKFSFGLNESVSSSPRSGNLTSTETQTADYYRSSVRSDVLLSLNTTETQTCFEEAFQESM